MNSQKLTAHDSDTLPVPTLDDVKAALRLAPFDYEAAWRQMAPRPRAFKRSQRMPGQARPAAVLMLLYPVDGRLTFVLTRRTETVSAHRGQISLPGGAREDDDLTPLDTALREAYEEVSVPGEAIEILGMLTPIYLPVSDFEVHPVVGYIAQRPDFVIAPDEVAELLEMSLADLLDARIKREERWTIRNFEMDVPFYALGEHAVWGATAIILSEFEARLKAAMGSGA